MSALAEELTRLQQALDHLEQALVAHDQRATERVEAARREARAEAAALSARVDQAIGRLESVLGG